MSNYTRQTIAPLSNIVLKGRLGKDPELTYLQSGKAMAKFSLATERYDRQSQERVTEWVNVTLFGRPAESAHEHLSKGRQIVIIADELTASVKADGGDKIFWDVVANRFEFADSSNGERSSAANPPTDTNLPADDEIPF